MSDQTAKQQIVDRLKDVDTVLVTVNTNPSVDELSAALGFTLLINKLNKHGTAVFSGSIPPAITFLDPEKTFENTVDSLRDFIIALDKEKADHLRYKVDGDMVKIFITPYRTTISEKDLDFSQGDYNVEMVIAIGVKNNDDLDKALADHGRILHDATVAALSLGGGGSSELGSINWHENDVSSYCEMLVGVVESLRSDKTLIDEQIATAFLTGIVAATERFSNEHTTSKTMTMAAQLMAAGANQQLIATKLAEGGESIDTAQNPSEEKKHNNDGTTALGDGELTKVDRKKKDDEPVEDKQAADGSMKVSHTHEGDLDEVAKKVHADQQKQATEEASEQLASLNTQPTQESTAEQELSARIDQPAAQSASISVADLQKDLKAASDELETAAQDSVEEVSLPAPVATTALSNVPSLGGTLNATTDQAAEDARKAAADERNRTLLSHGDSQYVGNPPTDFPPLNAAVRPADHTAEPPSVDPLGGSHIATSGVTIQPPSADSSLPAAQPTIAQLEQQSQAALDVQNALGGTMPAPALPPVAVSPSADGGLPPLPPLPPMPDFSTLPPLPGAPAANPFLTPAPATDASTAPLVQTPAAATVAAAPVTTDMNDPTQFKIPGQP